MCRENPSPHPAAILCATTITIFFIAVRVRPCSQPPSLSPVKGSRPLRGSARRYSSSSRGGSQERNTRQLTAWKHEDGTSPPPVRRKGASKKSKQQRRCAGGLRDSPFSPVLGPAAPEPRPVSRRSRRPSHTTRIALPRPAISSRRTRRPTHHIPSHPSRSRGNPRKRRFFPNREQSCRRRNRWKASCSFLVRTRSAQISSRSSLGNAFLRSLARGILLGDCKFAACRLILLVQNAKTSRPFGCPISCWLASHCLRSC